MRNAWNAWEFISIWVDASVKSSKCGIIFRSWVSALSYRSSNDGEKRECSIILYLYHGYRFHHGSIVDRAFLYFFSNISLILHLSGNSIRFLGKLKSWSDLTYVVLTHERNDFQFPKLKLNLFPFFSFLILSYIKHQGIQSFLYIFHFVSSLL